MRKLTFVLFLMGIAVFELLGIAYAVEMYYTFEGAVSEIRRDDAGIIADAGYEVGSDVTYTFLIDFDRLGTMTYNNGFVAVESGGFYVDYISGSALQEKDGGYKNADADVAEYNRGGIRDNVIYIYGGTDNSFINLNSGLRDSNNNYIYIHFNWNIGDAIGSRNTAYDSNGAYSELQSHLILTQISDTAPGLEPPIADAGDNITLFSENQNSTILYGKATDPDNDPLTYRWLEAGTELSTWEEVGANGEAELDLSTIPYLPLGEHILTLEVSDGQATSSDEMTLTIDNSAPQPAPTGGGTYQIGDPVSLGGQVSDFDGDWLIYEWLEGDEVKFDGQVEALYGGNPVALPEHELCGLDIGSHEVTLRVTDEVNEPVSRDIIVEVVDTTDPTLAPSSDKTILWPPNHKMVDITVLANANDNSGGPVSLSAMVSSNEPQDGLGDGDTFPDWTEANIDEDNGIIALKLRAESSGSGHGRVYTVTITATDESNNNSTADIEIIVPHDKRKK